MHEPPLSEAVGDDEREGCRLYPRAICTPLSASVGGQPIGDLGGTIMSEYISMSGEQRSPRHPRSVLRGCPKIDKKTSIADLYLCQKVRPYLFANNRF